MSTHTPWRALGLLCTVQFVLVLDASIVAVSLPQLRADLALPDHLLQYTLSLYAVGFGGLLVFGGRAADLYGRRRFLQLGIALFGLASMGCGLAANATALLAGRTMQGVGAALASPAALALVVDLFGEEDRRATVLGAWGAVSAAGGAAGLVLGGVLTDTVGWRWVFYLNVPVCLAAAGLTAIWLPERRSSGVALDAISAALVTLGLGAWTFGLTEVESRELASPSSGGAMLVGTALLITFVRRQRVVDNPLVPLDLFAPTLPRVANLGAAIIAALIAAQNFFGSLTLQRVLGRSAVETGFAILPVTILATLGSALAGMVVRRLGVRGALVTGLVVMGGGLGLLVGVDSAWSALDLAPGFGISASVSAWVSSP
ncbi:MAG: MFS transporter [Myxococcota bacterium]